MGCRVGLGVGTRVGTKVVGLDDAGSDVVGSDVVGAIDDVCSRGPPVGTSPASSAPLPEPLSPPSSSSSDGAWDGCHVGSADGLCVGDIGRAVEAVVTAVLVRVEVVAPVHPCHNAHWIGHRTTICGPSLQRRLRHKSGSALDGRELGAGVGVSVGMFVGLYVGPVVGAGVGATVRNVGDRVGRFDGTGVGDAEVGLGVGLAV